MTENAQKMIEKRMESPIAIEGSTTTNSVSTLEVMPKTLPTISSTTIPSMQKGSSSEDDGEKTTVLQARIYICNIFWRKREFQFKNNTCLNLIYLYIKNRL